MSNQLYADGLIGFGMHRFVRLASLYTKVFYYKNSYVGRYSHLYYPGDKPYGTLILVCGLLPQPQ